MSSVIGWPCRGARALLVPTRTRSGQRPRLSHHIAAAADWSYGPYPAGTDWPVAQGAYSDPRAAPPGARPRPSPAPERPPDGPCTSYDGGQGVQDSDPLSEIARVVVDAVAGFLSAVVGTLSNWVLSLLPSHVKRRAVENSVKGAMALLGMALLQSVLSFILTVGTVVLAVYTAHQVFGLQVPFLSGGGRPDRGGIGPEGPAQPGSGAGPGVDPRLYGNAVPPYPGYGPYQQGYDRYSGYGGQGQPYPSRPRAADSKWTQGPRAAAQGPVIDVYYESP